MHYQPNFFFEEPPAPVEAHPPLCACGSCAVTVERFEPVINVGFGDRDKLQAILSGKIVTTKAKQALCE